MMLNKQKFWNLICFALAAVFLAACQPKVLETSIMGIDGNEAFGSLPAFSLDYTRSADQAQKTNSQQALDNHLRQVRVFLNDVDITAAMTFGPKTAQLTNARLAENALKEGANKLSVRQLAGAGVVAANLDEKTFVYSTKGPKLIVSDALRDNGWVYVDGYVLSDTPVTSAQLNDTSFAIDGKRFSVQVPAAKDYLFVIEDASGKKTQKRYADEFYVNHAVRTRIGASTINSSGLREKIVETLESGQNISIDNPRQIADFDFNGIKINLSLTQLKLGSLNIRDIRFMAHLKGGMIQVQVGLDVRNSDLSFNVQGNAFGGGLNVPGDAGIGHLTLNATFDFSLDGINQKLAMANPSLAVSMSGLNVNVPLLPAHFQGAISPLINSLANQSDAQLAEMLDGVIKGIGEKVLGEIRLAAGITTDAVKMDARVIHINSDDSSAYISLQIATAPASHENNALGSLVLDYVRNANLKNVEGDFRPYANSVVHAYVRNPEARSHLGMGIAADMVNQLVMNVYRSGALKRTAYLKGGELLVQDEQPAGLKDLDVRLGIRLASPVEFAFGGSSSELDAHLTLPLTALKLDLRQGSGWLDLGTLYLYTEVPTKVSVVGGTTVKLTAVSDQVKLQLVDIEGNFLLGQFSFIVDLVAQLTPRIGAIINEAGELDLSEMFENLPVQSVQVYKNDQRQIGLDMNLSFK